jgi:chromosome segregation ATPase
MARFVNIHKQGLREQARQNEKMHLELVKYIDTSKTQGCNDLIVGFSSLQKEANLELVKHIDTFKMNADLSASLEGERELKRSKTEAFDKQGVELERVKQENYDMSNTKSGLIGEADQLRAVNERLTNANAKLVQDAVQLREEVKTTLQTNADFASEVTRHNAVIHELRQQVTELLRDNKQLETEKAGLYQIQQKRTPDDSPPRRGYGGQQSGLW